MPDFSEIDMDIMDEPHIDVSICLTLLGQLERSINAFIRQHVEDEKLKELYETESYDYVPFDPNRFIDLLGHTLKGMNKATPKDRRKLRFIDVGCGLGIKQRLARMVYRFDTAHGIEINQHFVQIARRACSIFRTDANHPLHVFKKDILKFKHYGNYDIIYLYRPLIGSKNHRKLMRIIAEQMKAEARVVYVDGIGYEFIYDKEKLLTQEMD